MRVIRIEQFELIVLKTKPNQSYQKHQPEYSEEPIRNRGKTNQTT